jgi:tRNA-dihydrouridine synthase B
MAPGDPVRIGNIEFDSPVMLAPLAGVSDSPFRQLARGRGVGGHTEMVSADGLVRGNRATLITARSSRASVRSGGLFGSDPAVW